MIVIHSYGRQKLANAIFRQKKQHYTPFPKLIKEMALFWNSIFLQLS